MATFPDNSFWDFSLSVYSRPHVADACVFLQDRYELDVNLLLFCIWVGDAGKKPLEADALRDCMRRTRDWRTRVIEPLRSIRRACRAEPLGVPEFLLEACVPSMRDAELDAERVAQLVLADIVRHQPSESIDDAAKARRALHNLRAYIAVVGCESGGQLDDCLRTVFTAAFPDAEFAASD